MFPTIKSELKQESNYNDIKSNKHKNKNAYMTSCSADCEC